MKILVTGGAGYIGSVVTEELLKENHEVTVFDNLSTGHRESVAPKAALVVGDLLETDKLTEVLRENEAVIHLAASSLVSESVENPAKYYQNNVTAGLSLLEAMRRTNVKKIVFSSTAAVYGEPKKQPIEESQQTAPTNPYGETKLAFENALRRFETANYLRFASLRYFNAAGASENYGEIHEPETHLIPIVLQTALGQREAVEIFGDDYPTTDGTCVRDYVHVSDLAQAHIAVLDILDERSAIYNLGCGGAGFSVKEVIETAREVTKCEIKVRLQARRTGDAAILVANCNKIKNELGWKPQTQNLHEIIASAWNWMKSNPNGYKK